MDRIGRGLEEPKGPDEKAEAYRVRQAAVEVAVATLREHFDAVQIVGVVGYADESYDRHHAGSGLWVTRYGLVKEWLADCETRGAARIMQKEAGGDG